MNSEGNFTENSVIPHRKDKSVLDETFCTVKSELFVRRYYKIQKFTNMLTGDVFFFDFIYIYKNIGDCYMNDSMTYNQYQKCNSFEILNFSKNDIEKYLSSHKNIFLNIILGRKCFDVIQRKRYKTKDILQHCTKEELKRIYFKSKIDNIENVYIQDYFIEFKDLLCDECFGLLIFSLITCTTR